MCEDVAGRSERGPLSDRPTEELRAVRDVFAGDYLDRSEARYVLRIVDGEATLMETGELATVRDGALELRTSTLWRASLREVIRELDRRGM